MIPLSHYISLIGILTILYILHRSFHIYTKRYLRFIDFFSAAGFANNINKILT